MRPTHQGHDARLGRNDSFSVSDTFLETRPATVRTAGTGPADRGALPPFPTVRRGYDPAVVDDAVAALLESLSAVRTALEGSERRRTLAEQHALAVEDEIRAVRATRPAEPESGFGARAERMLRLAESEAAEVKANAARSAGDLLERTRQEAERHRHEARLQLDAERSRAEEHLARRAAVAQEREDTLRDRLLAVEAEAETIRAAAARSADAHRAAAEADVRERHDRAAQQIGRARADATVELERLRSLRAGVADDLRAVAGVLISALAPQPAGPGAHRAEVAVTH